MQVHWLRTHQRIQHPKREIHPARIFSIRIQTVDKSALTVKNWVDEADYEKNNAAPDVQWWTADEYEAWMNEQKKEMESLIGTGDGWYEWARHIPRI